MQQTINAFYPQEAEDMLAKFIKTKRQTNLWV